jgi:hypothetical protein
MLDLDARTFEFPCPKCGFYNPVYLRQVRLRDVIICRGCKRDLQLDDHMNDYRLARRRIQNALKTLQRSLGSHTITIRL